MICKFEKEAPQPEEESPDKKKKKDPLKVDKKYLWPHGITPPCKNVRKRRFRKTLKKKYVEAPEIEKEVKRLLKIDNDAVHVKYEIIDDHEEGNKGGQDMAGGSSWQDASTSGKDNQRHNRNADVSDSRDVGEHEIFGEVSSSDDDEEHHKSHMLDDDNSMSADDSRMSDSNYMMKNKSRENRSTTRDYDRDESQDGDYNVSRRRMSEPLTMTNHFIAFQNPPRDTVDTRINDLRQLLVDLKMQRSQKLQEISGIQNQTLRQRLQDNLDNLVNQINDKEAELNDLESYQKRGV